MSAKVRLPYRFITAIIVVGLVSIIVPPVPTRAISDSMVISQFQVGGATTADEFIEIHNVSSYALDINGYKLAFRSFAGTSDTLLVTWSTSTIIPAGGFYLIAAEPGYDGAVPEDAYFDDGGGGRLSGSSGGLGLRDASDALLDSVGYGGAINAFVETSPTPVPPAEQSRSRLGDGCTDTDNNLNDFSLTNPSGPRNSSSSAVHCVPPDISPVIVATNPLNGAMEVTPGMNITIEFSEPVTIMPDAFFELTCNSVEQDGTVSGSGNSYAIDPSAHMPNDANCEVTVYASAVVDQDVPLDQMVVDYEFGFTIAPVDDPPTVIHTTPEVNATGVLVDAAISITFSEAVSLEAGFASISCTSGAHTYGIDDSANPVMTLTPQVVFSFGDTCSVMIDHSKVTDQDGTPDTLESDYGWDFTTVIDPAPAVATTTPLPDAVGIGLSETITVTFNEPVNVTTGWYSIVCASSGTHTADISGGPLVFTLDPTVHFIFGELCTVTLDHTRITDQDGDDPLDGMVSDHSFSFQIQAPTYFSYCSLILKLP